MPYIPDGITEIDDNVEAAVRDAASAAGPALQEAGRLAVKAGKGAAQTGYSGLTWFGRRVRRVWDAVERAASPPWTVGKVAMWVVVAFLFAGATVIAYQVQYGILTLPMVEEAGAQFIAWMASLGALGLFGFTAVTTLFFMFIPTEPFFLVALAGGVHVEVAIVAAALGSALGACVNYWFGRRLRVSAGKKTGDDRKLGKWGQRVHSKWGMVLLVLCAVLPAPEVASVAYGLADYPFKRFALVMLVGRTVKWIWIAGAMLAFGVRF